MSYAEDGYEIVRGAIQPWLADAINTVAALESSESHIPMAHTCPGLPIILGTVRLANLVQKARECVGGEPAALNSEYFFGRPGTKGFNMHQDNHFIQAPPGHLVSCWIALTDVTEANGCLIVFPGSQRHGLLPIARKDPGNRVDSCSHPMCDFLTVPMQRGDAIFMHGELVHSSCSNISPHGRESLTIAYIRKGSPFNPGRRGRVEIDVT